MWQRFCNESIRWRVTKDKYQQLAKELLTEERIPSPLLVKYVLDGQIDGDITADPLLCNYVEVLLDMDAFDRCRTYYKGRISDQAIASLDRQMASKTVRRRHQRILQTWTRR